MRWLALPFHLSIDAALVPAGWYLLAQRAFEGRAAAPLDWPGATVVFLSVWLGYTADRWLDVRGQAPEAFVFGRRRFLARHQHKVALAWPAVLAGDVLLALTRLELHPLRDGLLLMVVAVAAVLGVQCMEHRRGHPLPRSVKPLLTAVLMAWAATVFHPGIPRAAAISPHLVLLGIPLAVLFAFNAVLAAAWEEPFDEIERGNARGSSPAWKCFQRRFLLLAFVCLVSGIVIQFEPRTSVLCHSHLTALGVMLLLAALPCPDEPRHAEARHSLANLALLTPWLALPLL